MRRINAYERNIHIIVRYNGIYIWVIFQWGDVVPDNIIFPEPDEIGLEGDEIYEKNSYNLYSNNINFKFCN